MIDNAVKFSNRGNVIHIEISSDERFVILKVRDHGIGIPNDDLPVVWNRFFRGNQALRQTQGIGLGLSFVKAMPEAHGGQVQLSSTEGVGTEVGISLPLTK